MNWHDTLDRLLVAGTLPRRILLIGPPGTGKSRWAERLGAWERVTLHQAIDPADLLGTWQLRTAGDGQAETVFMDGPASRALRGNGCALVLDEIDQAGPEVTCLLYALLDDPPAVTLASGERAVAGKDYRVIATSNQSASVLPAALLDRFDCILTADVPVPEIYGSIPQQHHAALTRAYARAPSVGWSRTIGVRTLISYARLSQTLGSENGARVVFGDASSDALIALTIAQGDKIA